MLPPRREPVRACSSSLLSAALEATLQLWSRAGSEVRDDLLRPGEVGCTEQWLARCQVALECLREQWQWQRTQAGLQIIHAKAGHRPVRCRRVVESQGGRVRRWHFC